MTRAAPEPAIAVNGAGSPERDQEAVNLAGRRALLLRPLRPDVGTSGNVKPQIHERVTGIVAPAPA